MGKDVIIRGETYNGVGKVNLLTANGSANFYDVSGALCTITAEYDEVEEYDEVYTSDKTAQEVYDALEVGINPVFRFHNLLDDDAYIYASLTKLESTEDGEELTLSSFQTDAMTAATANDYFSLTVQGEAPAVQKTVSGSIITVTDALAAPAVALSTAINPVQDLHGYDSPWPAGAKKNKLPTYGIVLASPSSTSFSNATKRTFSANSYCDGVSYNNYYSANHNANLTVAENSISFTGDSTSYGVSIPVIGLTTGVSWTISATKTNCKLSFGFYQQDGTFISGAAATQGVTAYTQTVPADTYYTLIGFTPATANSQTTVTDIQLEQGSSATPYIPYSNICPISGFSAANIVVSPTTTAGDGTTYTVSFGAAGTVYDGTLDVVNGTLTARPHYPSYNGETLVGPWVSSMDAYAEGTTPTTGAQVVDLGGTATTYTLTPTEVQMLLGTNNVWSDTGDTTLTYLADGRVNSLTALNMLLGGMYEPSSDVTDKEALSIIMGESE